MMSATVIMAVIALALLAIGYRRGDGSHREGIRIGFAILKQTAPLLLLAFLASGLLETAVEPAVIQRWLGADSGWLGPILGSVAGGLIPAGPYVAMPLVGAIYQAGAGLGTAVAMVTAWSLWSIALLVFEFAFMGYRFTLVRVGLALVFPPLAGWAALTLFG